MESSHVAGMSMQEIIAELPKLTRLELEEVNGRLKELLVRKQISRAGGGRLRRFAGSIEGLPSDMARNHDHYLHGRPKE